MDCGVHIKVNRKDFFSDKKFVMNVVICTWYI